jgi:hypothetical protein
LRTHQQASLWLAIVPGVAVELYGNGLQKSTVSSYNPRSRLRNRFDPHILVTGRVSGTSHQHNQSVMCSLPGGRFADSIGKETIHRLPMRHDDLFFATRLSQNCKRDIFSPGYRHHCEAQVIERTPTQFRNFYSEWKKTAPANDSDIIPDEPRFAETPKHAGMCADLKAMLAWREMKESKDPLQTNFLQSGMDDEIVSEDGGATVPIRDNECELEIRPTVNEMLDAVKGVVFKTRCDHAVIFWRGFTVSTERRVPDLAARENDGAIGYGEEYESTTFPGCKMRSIVRLGELHFSDAEGYELHPRGSLMLQIDKPGTPNGLSKKFMPPPEHQRFNPEERLIAMQEATFANDNVSPEHVKVLDEAIVARNFTVVGKAFGFAGKTAERRGKRLVLEAAKGFSAVLQQVAA